MCLANAVQQAASVVRQRNAGTEPAAQPASAPAGTAEPAAPGVATPGNPMMAQRGAPTRASASSSLLTGAPAARSNTLLGQ